MNATPKLSPLTRRDFIRLALAAGGTVVLSPLLKACARPVTPTATAAAMPTATATPMATAVPTEEDPLAGLSGLDIDAFFDKAYARWLIRDPENLTTLGLADFYGIGDANLTDISDVFLRQTQVLESGTLDILRAYDHSIFTPTQAINADVYDWFLDDLVRGHMFMYDDYPLNPIVTSVHYNLYMLFTVYHPLNNRQDAEDYIARLSQVGKKITDLVDGLQRRQERGVILPAFIIPIVLADINQIARKVISSQPYYTAFNERLTGVSANDRETLSAQVKDQVTNTVMPAYQQLAAYLSDLKSQATNTVGVWQFSDGEAYYAQSLRRQTTTELTADEIHELGKQHVERVQAEMRTLFADLGYDSSKSIQDLYGRMTEDSGVYTGQAAVSAFETAIREAEAFLPQAFDILPRAQVEVVGGPAGNYYMPASYDSSRPGLFYANTSTETPKFGIKTLVYHETNPGHHLQTALAMEQTGLPALRQGVQFNAYTEGWALYAERLMAELGAYADDPQGNLGRLQMEAYRAARLVVDTGIHAKRWTFDQAVDYFAAASGLPAGTGRGEITRYCVFPAQATSYFIGFLKFLELRQKAKDALGNKFDLKAFHHVILVNGSVPLSILENLVNSYIESVG
jgi:uncharacterized protein (DUF885 family)